MSAVSCQIWKRTWIFVFFLYQAVSFHIALDWRKLKTRRYDFLQQFFDLSWRTSSKPKTAVEHCDICLAWYYSQCQKYQWFTNPMLVRNLPLVIKATIMWRFLANADSAHSTSENLGNVVIRKWLQVNTEGIKYQRAILTFWFLSPQL